MQFITNGPDVPDALLQAHEEGRVVFFCGAGISYPAGLPGFSGLVDKIYSNLGVTPSAVQQAAIKVGQFDTAISLLESDIVGGRESVRRALAAILTPDLKATNAMKIHESLLTLSKLRDGRTRLITTNFDRIFEEVIAAKSMSIEKFQAPLLPVPKNRWDGVVYLHGLLSHSSTASELDRLVISSGDFGLAYLTERWAARFVSELFRNYSVCFIGYSINDPVLRYMMDALAADRLLGEAPPEMFAFGSYSKGKKEARSNEWRAKNVTPILYREHNRHAYLRQTLQAWAETYRDGVQGKEAVVVKHALTRPQGCTPQDNFVGRLLWALSDKSGLPAKRFADFNPAPSLEWLLEAFTQEQFGHSDLIRFGVVPRNEVDAKLRFSMIRRPSPYDCGPPMLLVSGYIAGCSWDNVMFQLARWLVRHLDDPRLIIWIAERGGRLHEQWARLIESELDRITRLEREGKTSELNEIRLNAPKAIPSTQIRILWRLILSGRVKSTWQELGLYSWEGRLKREGLSTTLRLELRELLAPKVVLKKPYRWVEEYRNLTDEPPRIKELVDWELVLTSDHINSAMRNLGDSHWMSALPYLLDDFQFLLLDALNLQNELGEADDHDDRSRFDLPSISPHKQNRGYRDWVKLIELLRDSWMVVYATDGTRASKIAQNWFEQPFPTFKRLALYAASQAGCIQEERWVDWLLVEDSWWLWTEDTRREVCRLLVLQGRHLAELSQKRLEIAILNGPPRNMYRQDLEEERWQHLITRSVWLRLAKLRSSGIVLGAIAAKRFLDISVSHPTWQLTPNQSDEFSYWMSGSGDPDYEDSRQVDIAPRMRKELVQWLTKPKSELHPFDEDTWSEVCRTRFSHSFSALDELAKTNVWPAGRWREALDVWSEDALILRSWKFAAKLVMTMPNAVMQEAIHAVSRWIESASKSINRNDEILLGLCRRILEMELDSDSSIRIHRNGVVIEDPVSSAINHPIGHITQALINLWFKQNPNDNDQLPNDLKPLFTMLCDMQIDRYRHGRVLLGSQLIAFFRVDRNWTEQYLLPSFSWDNLSEAKSVWEGFLWSPRLYQPLLIAFKTQFLDTANHYAELGEHRQQFITFLTYVALARVEDYTIAEYRAAFSMLPQEGLEEVAQALCQALEGSGEQCEDYWQNRVQPFLQQIWPKSRNLATSSSSESLARLAIAARGEFPAAYAAVRGWLHPIEHPHYVIHRLYESGLCIRFPSETLLLLNAVLTELLWAPDDLRKCLDQMTQANQQLTQDARYQRISENLRRHGV
jgi:hypothetical protein